MKVSNTAGILVVDDDPVVRELVADAIADAGFEVDVCGDGVEALGKMKRKLMILSLPICDYQGSMASRSSET